MKITIKILKQNKLILKLKIDIKDEKLTKQELIDIFINNVNKYFK